MATTQPDSEFTLRLRRTFAAPRAKVFEAWTQKEMLEQWMCRDEKTHDVKYTELDVRPGGRYMMKISAPNGIQYDLGGVFRELGDWMARRRGLNPAQQARAENAGVLTASGLIAGEAICGLLWAGVIALSYAQQPWLHLASAWATRVKSAQIFEHPLYLSGIVVMALLAGLMIFLPLSSAGDPNEPAPPTAMM